MAQLPGFSAWKSELRDAFGHLSEPQVKALAEFSFGMILAEGSGLPRVAWTLSQLWGESFDTVRERLRDFYRSAEAKPGTRRRQVEVNQCFGPLLAWLLRDWPSRHLPLALDAMHLGERFVVLAISVVYRSGAIPVAWKILPAHNKGSWKPHWLGLIEHFANRVPSEMQVIALADRGLYAKWLFEAVVQRGWQPFFRINAQHNAFEPQGQAYRPLTTLIQHPGQRFAARGTMFRGARSQLPCTLLGQWDPVHDEPCWVVTRGEPERVACDWYGMRFWIERGFFHTQSGGWNWQQTRITQPDRAERQWLVMAVASVLLLRQGGRCDIEQQLPRTTAAKPRTARQDGKPSSAPTRRILSVFCAGLLIVRMALLTGQPLPHSNFNPEPWPSQHPSSPAHDNDLPPPAVAA